jgi:ELWxxDGT repeat protein
MYKKLGLFFIACFILISEARSQSFIKNFNAVSSYAALGSSLLFAGDDGVHGSELWKTDGTIAGTVMVKDINPGIGSSITASICIFNNKAYFSAYDGINGMQVWQSDGTANGTVMLKNWGVLLTGNGAQPAQFTVCNGALYFVQTSDGITFSLWKTNGTANGTVQITANDYSTISQLTAVGNMLYYTTSSGLWQSDGTATGTKHITVDNFYLTAMLHNVNGQLVFITADTYSYQHANVYALSPANGTPVLLQSFSAVTYGNILLDNMTAVGSNFFFSLRSSGIDAGGTDALWTSDCTPAGTKMVASYNWEQGIAYDYMRGFISFNNKLYFASTTNATLFTSDGTAAGTVQAASATVDYGIGPVISNGKIFFSNSGRLWSYDGANAQQELKQPTGPQGLFDDNGRLYFTTGASYSAALWNNAPAGQLQVTMGYQSLANGGTSAITSKPDSVVTNQVNVTNNGNSTLVFGEIGISGDSFYVNGTPSQTVPPGGQVSFNLLYSPLKAEQVSALLTIKSNDDSGGAEFFYNFTGTSSGAAVQKTTVPAGGLEKEIIFADTVSGFTLSNAAIAENTPVNAVIGAFKVNNTPGYQYQLVTGAGSADNASFTIVNGNLQSAAVPVFAIKNTYSIRVQATN